MFKVGDKVKVVTSGFENCRHHYNFNDIVHITFINGDLFSCIEKKRELYQNLRFQDFIFYCPNSIFEKL